MQRSRMPEAIHFYRCKYKKTTAFSRPILYEIIRDAISEAEYSGDYRDCFGSKFQLQTIYFCLFVLPVIAEASLQETDFRPVASSGK